MNEKDKFTMVSRAEYDALLNRLMVMEAEKNRLSRELRTSDKRNEILKLNFDTQMNLNKTITDEKLKQEMYVRLLLEYCPDIIFIFDENTKFLLGTKSICKIVNMDDVSLLQGRALSSIVERYRPPAFTRELIASVDCIVKNHTAHRTEKKLEIATNNNKYEVNILSFHKDDTGEFAGVLVIMHDITELIIARESAEKASSAKGQFLSRMSHEMRTPMNAIIGMTNIAKGSKDPEKKEYCLEKIDGASKHLLGLINDILDMAKIEADKFELSNHEFDFEKTLVNVTNVLNFRIEENRQTLIINLDKEVPLSLIGDELRLTQVISNLLTNAVKFTPEGGTITLIVKNLSEENGRVTLCIEVADTGIGISAEQQSRLFTSFEQADGGIARKFGGTGLGLAISKRIVELMGGSIWIESKIGEGSKFIFTAVFEKGAAKTQSKLDLVKKDIHILAVDDSAETREYFASVMEELEISCDVAADGYEALHMITHNIGRPYNIFFVDWQMPEMNGVELTRRIKEYTSDSAIVIMISVAEWSDIEKDAVVAGVDYFVSKPLFPSVLISAVNKCLTAQCVENSMPQSELTKRIYNYSNYTLLIAEDVEINREIMSAILEDTGIMIDFAHNGLEAIDLFVSNPGKYSAILMDIHMPEMDGYEATRAIRRLQYPEAQNIPVIAMTANVFREDIEKCIQAGMNDHLGKPVDTDEFFKKLQQYLPKLT